MHDKAKDIINKVTDKALQTADLTIREVASGSYSIAKKTVKRNWKGILIGAAIATTGFIVLGD